ncbi:unnamed protein product [Angiostrongylus costaricensis]|uniref:TRUD domain-containing protein n=1 Tax=Angiostrongylus costaricensis TaxID=334426 RepID=A0A158PHH0_ANGCS|nr:unnamed protein product [Angiostrongylus costaricensis]
MTPSGQRPDARAGQAESENEQQTASRCSVAVQSCVLLSGLVNCIVSNISRLGHVRIRAGENGIASAKDRSFLPYFLIQTLDKFNPDADQSVLRLVTTSEVQKYVKDEEDKAVNESVSVPSVVTADQISALDGLNKTSAPLKITCEKLSKDDRKAFHEFVRLRYQGKLSSETKNNAIEISYCGVNSRTRKRKRWDQHCPDYCHFTLAKENKDTSYALGERILSLNTHLRDIVVYDVKYEHDELKMGGHWGNRFHIILRSIPLESRNILEDRLREFVLHGFINYFGTQRFGTCGTNTAAVGKKILQRDWEGAIELILSNNQMNGYLGSVGDASRCWKETGDASVALKKLKGSQAYASIEAIIFKCLAKGGTWQKCITEALPINLRSLYVHAYQSLLWNKVVSRRISENGAVVCTDDLGSDGKKLPSDASPFDIYIPLPGENVTFERNYVTKWYEELLTEDGLSFSSFSTLEDRFALGETTRAMLISPKDVRWKFIRYSNPRAYLQDGLSTQAIDDSEMVGDLMAVQVEFSLSSGCYATIALRQITGTDMGKQSMKIHSESARNDECGKEGSGKPDGDSIGDKNILIMLIGDVTPTEMGSDDGIFIHGLKCPQTSTHTAADTRQDVLLEKEGNDNRQQCTSKESDENPNPAIAFRDLVIRAARDYLENSQYSDHPYATPLPSGTLIRPYDPHPNMPGRTRSPNGPLFPAPDPLQPIPNPMNPLIQPPGVNPFGPAGAPFGGPRGPFGGRNPLDPFDPNNREIFPSRPDRGVPRGEPRFFPANRWDRNDFI